MKEHTMTSPSISAGDSFYIAGLRTNEDWKTDSADLEIGKDADKWKTIFEDYFMERLYTRYLDPIRKIQEIGSKIGEGFSIVAIQCSLIEFLQTTIEGTNFNIEAREGNTDNEYGLKKSTEKFTTFLITQEPFKSFFPTDGTLALNFYRKVRCPVLHEARTSDGWLIRADSDESASCFRWIKQEDSDRFSIKIHRTPCLIKEIPPVKKILYRNDFTAALWQFIEAYGEKLQTDEGYQEAFKRKFDALAKP